MARQALYPQGHHDGEAVRRKALEAGAAGYHRSPTTVAVCWIRCPATAEVLPAIVDAVGGKMQGLWWTVASAPAWTCSRRLALGADAVLIARPFVTAVYGAGAQEGVQAYVDKLAGELADTMSMCGAHSLAEITRNMVRV